VPSLTRHFELDQPDLVSGDYRISYAAVRAYRRGEPLQLRPKEFLLFELFLRNRGHVLSREQLISYISDRVDRMYERTLDVHIMRLRKNLRLRRWGDPITTIRECGYRLD
jgi:DNA-binding response OmpR family regulator